MADEKGLFGKLFGKKEPKKDLEEAARKEVMAFLGRIDANKARLSRVFLTGGGAPFYQRALVEKLPGYQIHTLQNSVMGNARGYWLSGCDEFDG